MSPSVSSRFVWVVSLLGMGVAAIAVFGLYRLIHPPRDPSRECRNNLKTLFTTQRALWHERDAYSPTFARLDFYLERGNLYAYFIGPGLLEERGSSGSVEKTGGLVFISGGNVVGDTAQGVAVDLARFPGRRILFSQLPPEVARQVGVSGTCPECEVTMACAAQLDEDATLDVWSISSAERTLADGERIPAGALFRHVNDEDT